MGAFMKRPYLLHTLSVLRVSLCVLLLPYLFVLIFTVTGWLSVGLAVALFGLAVALLLRPLFK
jgi:hypothetical protein